MTSKVEEIRDLLKGISAQSGIGLGVESKCANEGCDSPALPGYDLGERRPSLCFDCCEDELRKIATKDLVDHLISAIESEQEALANTYNAMKMIVDAANS